MILDPNGGLYSPGYFAPVPGGDIIPYSDGLVQPPQYSADFVTAGTDVSGATGDSTDTSKLWSTFAGIAGSFLSAFTGKPSGTVSIGGSSAPPKPAPATAAANIGWMWVLLALAVIVILVLALRK